VAAAAGARERLRERRRWERQHLLCADGTGRSGGCRAADLPNRWPTVGGLLFSASALLPISISISPHPNPETPTPLSRRVTAGRHWNESARRAITMHFAILVGGTGPTESIAAVAGRVAHLWRATTSARVPSPVLRGGCARGDNKKTERARRVDSNSGSTQFTTLVQTAVKVHKTGSFREIFRNRRMGIHRVGSCNRRTVQPPARI